MIRLRPKHSFDLAELSPEQGKAVKVLETVLLNWKPFVVQPNLSLGTICTHNAKFFCLGYLNTSRLPRGDNWSWNQSRSRQTITSNSNITGCFYKLSTRKTPSSGIAAPNFKLWIFNISPPLSFFENCVPPGSLDITVIWCEKGFKSVPILLRNCDDDTVTNFLPTIRPQRLPEELYLLHREPYGEKWISFMADRKEGQAAGRKPTFTPKIPVSSVPQVPQVKKEVKVEKSSRPRRERRNSGGYRGQKNRNPSHSRPNTDPIVTIDEKDNDINLKLDEEIRETVVFDDRFEETIPGTFPVALPFITPNLHETQENLGKFLNTADSDSMMFVQLPGVLPIKADGKEAKPTPVRDLPNGYLGKLVVYRSGKVQIKIGDILFDAAIGTKSTCLQQVAHISTKEKKAIILGSVKERTVITPNIEHLLENDELSD